MNNKTENRKNPYIKLRNGYITFPRMYQKNIDLGYRNQGNKLTFRSRYSVEENKEGVKAIADYYEQCNGTSLNAVFKDLLKEVKDLYARKELYVTQAVSDIYNLGIYSAADVKRCVFENFAHDGNWHLILTEVINRQLAILQKQKKFPFNFEVELEKTEDYSKLPKISVKYLNVVMRQKADKKSMALFDATKERYEVMNDHINHSLVKRDGQANVIFPRKNGEYVEYGKDYEIFPEIAEGAIFEVFAALYFNKESKTMTIFPTSVCVHKNDRATFEDPFDISAFDFEAPAAPVSTEEKTEPKGKEEEKDDFDFPF